MKKTILLTSLFFCFVVGVQPQDCAPTPVAVSRYFDSDAVNPKTGYDIYADEITPLP